MRLLLLVSLLSEIAVFHRLLPSFMFVRWGRASSEPVRLTQNRETLGTFYKE